MVYRVSTNNVVFSIRKDHWCVIKLKELMLDIKCRDPDANVLAVPFELRPRTHRASFRWTSPTVCPWNQGQSTRDMQKILNR